MKRGVIIAILIFIVGYNGFSQENKRFSMTIQTNIGLYSSYYNYNSEWKQHSGKMLVNLIPTFEVGFKNKIFIKAKRYNLARATAQWTYETWFFDIRDTITDTVSRRDDLYAVGVSYNFLNKRSDMSLKAGIDLGIVYEKNADKYSWLWFHLSDNNLSPYIGLDLEYKYFITKHIAVGVDGMWGIYSGRFEVDLSDKYTNIYAYGLAGIISYTF
jgi:hypothetical protein